MPAFRQALPVSRNAIHLMQISANRKRVPILIIIGVSLIVLLSMAIINIKDSDDPDAHQRLYLYIGLMISCLYYTSLSVADYWRTLFSNRATFFIEPDGVVDNLSIFSCGKISWDEIRTVEVRQALKTNFLIIQVHNPDSIISRQRKWKQRTLRGFQKKFGSPVVISQKRIRDKVEGIKDVLADHLR
jgi:hypothetical protein